VPTEGAFRVCFVVGALAAFVGVAIAAMIPRLDRAAQPHENVSTDASIALSEV
jgi:hypothetical protein